MMIITQATCTESERALMKTWLILYIYDSIFYFLYTVGLGGVEVERSIVGTVHTTSMFRHIIVTTIQIPAVLHELLMLLPQVHYRFTNFCEERCQV